MPRFLDSMIKRAEADKQTIVLPESNDMRTLEAAETILKEGIANLVILGKEEEVRSCPYNLEGARIVDHLTDASRDDYAKLLFELRKHKGVTLQKAYQLLDNELYFGVMMVKSGDADGMVAGACHSTGDVHRASLQIIKTAPGVKLVSSLFVMDVPNCDYGEDGMFLFADCSLEVQPTAENLAHIAVNSARSWRSLIGTEPYVALLSHSTWGSAINPDAGKVYETYKIARELDPGLMIDGEIQLDAAVDPKVAEAKAPHSLVGGRANVLVFPDLDSGNIGYKLVQRLAKAEAYGAITQGLAAPVNDLSRGCTPADIVGVVAITCVQSQDRKKDLAKKSK